MDSIITFLLETNLLNFIIFATLVCFLYQRFVVPQWTTRNDELKRDLDLYKAKLKESQDQLDEANVQLERFSDEFKLLEEQQNQKVLSLKNNIQQASENKLKELHIKHGQEIERLRQTTIQELQSAITKMALQETETMFSPNVKNALTTSLIKQIQLKGQTK